MPRNALCLLLAALITAPHAYARQQESQAGRLRLELLSLGEGRLVELRLADRSKLRGWIGTISETKLELRMGEQRLETRALAFDQIRTVKPVKSLKPSHTGRNILIGVGIAVAAIGIGILIAAKKVGYI